MVMENRKRLTKSRGEKAKMLLWFMMFSIMALILAANPVFASSSGNIMRNIIEDITDNLIVPIFVSIGVLSALGGFGFLILSYKNEDPESKNRATMALVVAVALIAFPVFVKSLDLLKYL